jgi:hypothetical protein
MLKYARAANLFLRRKQKEKDDINVWWAGGCPSLHQCIPTPVFWVPLLVVYTRRWEEMRST